jgi:glycosyltransferase involved in cell wall biosynthesis
MRLVLLSWRSPGHPQGGGAEVLTEQLLRDLVRAGHEVTWFSAAFPGAAAEEVRDGILHVRRGRQWTVHFHAWRWLRRRRNRFDRVIDQVNTIPFFTPLYVDAARRRLFIFQMAREYWWRETRGAFRLIAPIGYFTEPWLLRVYRRTAAITISESTRRDLEALGLARAAVAIIPLGPGSDTPVAAALRPKDGPLTVVMLGRLTQAKFVEEGIDAFARIKSAVVDARLWIIGAGDPAYRRRLEDQVAELGLRDVEFHGRVEAARRQALLAAAHVHLVSSHREGWGLVVSEAAAAGTPSVGYDAPGVRDSIADPDLLAPIGDTTGLAERVLALQRDPTGYETARRAAWQRAREATSTTTSEAFASAVL